MNPRTGDEHWKDARFIRWQGIAMAQFSVAVALLSALSVSMLAAGFALALRDEVGTSGAHGLSLGLSLLLLAGVVLLCLLATVSRLLDFQLTARKVRGKACLTQSGLNASQFGRLSWACFWFALLLFLAASLLFVASCGVALSPRLLGYTA